MIRDFMGKTAPKAAPTVRIVKCVTLIQGNVMNLGVLFLNIRHQIVLVVKLDFMERRALKHVTTVGIVKHATNTRGNVTILGVLFQDFNHLLVMNVSLDSMALIVGPTAASSVEPIIVTE